MDLKENFSGKRKMVRLQSKEKVLPTLMTVDIIEL